MKKNILFFGLGVLITLMGVQVRSMLDTEVKENEALLKGLISKLDEYKLKCGHYPNVRIGLNALVNPKIENCNAESIIPMIPKDIWGGEIVYLENEKFFF